MTEVFEELFLIDTNILIYAFDTADPRKQKIAKELLELSWKKKITYTISAQNLAEFFVVVTQKIPGKIPLDQAAQIIQDIHSFSHWKVLHYDSDTIQKAVDLYKKTKKHFWDAVIVATMKQHGISKIYTENKKDFEAFEEIHSINPFV